MLLWFPWEAVFVTRNLRSCSGVCLGGWIAVFEVVGARSTGRVLAWRGGRGPRIELPFLQEQFNPPARVPIGDVRLSLD